MFFSGIDVKFNAFLFYNTYLSVLMDWAVVNLYVGPMLMKPHCNHGGHFPETPLGLPEREG